MFGLQGVTDPSVGDLQQGCPSRQTSFFAKPGESSELLKTTEAASLIATCRDIGIRRIEKHEYGMEMLATVHEKISSRTFFNSYLCFSRSPTEIISW